MDPNNAVKEAETKFNGAIDHFENELKKLRTGRASAGMLDDVKVEAYGQAMPMNQVATVSAPEAQLLQVTPFDPSNLQAIAAAIRNNQSLGFNPVDDGRVIRVQVPPLTEDRRRELAKQVGGKQEDCMVTLRNIRHDTLGAVDRAKKDKAIGEDDAKRLEKQVDDALGAARSRAEAAAKAKEQEIMSL